MCDVSQYLLQSQLKASQIRIMPDCCPEIPNSGQKQGEESKQVFLMPCDLSHSIPKAVRHSVSAGSTRMLWTAKTQKQGNELVQAETHNTTEYGSNTTSYVDQFQ